MKTFVYAAVAATIAASSAMASGTPIGLPGETHWTGAVSGLANSCEFRDNVSGKMDFNGAGTWTTSDAATLTVVQRGAIAVLVQPEQFVYEADSLNGTSDDDNGIAHAVNVNYFGTDDSKVKVISQNDNTPGMNGNDDEAELASGMVVSAVGDSQGTSLILDDTDLTQSKVAEMLIAEDTFTTAGQGLTGGITAGEMPRIMDLEIRGTATLVDAADLILVDNEDYALKHNVTCLQ